MGLWIFQFVIDRAGPKPNPVSIGDMVTQPINRREKMEKTKKKWIDDFMLLACIDLKKTHVQDANPVRLVPYRAILVGLVQSAIPGQLNF